MDGWKFWSIRKEAHSFNSLLQWRKYRKAETVRRNTTTAVFGEVNNFLTLLLHDRRKRSA